MGTVWVVGIVCTAPINTSRPGQQHDSQQKRTSSVDAGTVRTDSNLEPNLLRRYPQIIATKRAAPHQARYPLRELCAPTPLYAVNRHGTRQSHPIATDKKNFFAMSQRQLDSSARKELQVIPVQAFARVRTDVPSVHA